MNGVSGQFKRDALSFAVTLAVYLSLFFLWNHYFAALSAPLSQPDASKITLELNEFVKEPEVAEIPEVEKEEVLEEPEPVAKEEVPIEEEPPPEPIVEPEPKEPITEKPKPVHVEKPKPKVKKKIPKKIVKKKSKKKKKPTASQRRKTSSASSRGKQKVRSSSRGSSQFVARLRAKINARKSYPRIARKRGMQGSVRVKFRITSTGRLSGLSVSGSRIFINSAKQAVKSAFPISTRGASLPMAVSLTLNYRLKH